MRLCRDFALRTRRIRQDALLEEKKARPAIGRLGADGRRASHVRNHRRAPGIGVGRRCRNLWNTLVVGLAPVHHALPQPLRAGVRVGALREADAVRRACCSIGFSRFVSPTRESCAHGPWQRGADASAPALADTGAFRSSPSKRAAAQRRENPWTGLNAKLSEAHAKRADPIISRLAWGPWPQGQFSRLCRCRRARTRPHPVNRRHAHGRPQVPVRVRARGKKATPRHAPWGRTRLAVRRKKKLP